MPQIMIGTRLIDMPGARVRSKVTMKLTAPTVVEMPRKTMPERIEVDVRARVVRPRGVGHVVEPAVVGCLRRAGSRRTERCPANRKTQ